LVININKTNNHISPQIIEHITNTTIYDAGNTGPGLGQANKYGRVKPVNGISTIHQNKNTRVRGKVLRVSITG
jgi:hypothetical protein